MKKRNSRSIILDRLPIYSRVNTFCKAMFAFLIFLVMPMLAQAQVTLKETNTPLGKVLNHIEEKTDYTFLYNDVTIDEKEKVTINVTNKDVKSVLDNLFKKSNISYTISGKQIILATKPKQLLSDKQTIEGTVKNEEGETLIGVGVVIKGSTTGTVTDIDGKFSLKVTPDDILLLSYIGYRPQSIKVKDTQNYDFVLKEDNRLLDEVVVVGYGVEKKVNVIGSIAQVGADKLENRSTPQLSNALTGQMSGVTVIQRSGRPGDSGGEVRVRGVGSFGATPSALVLIDGIPGDMNDVSAENVESISVLKDASTAAIYGARAANGVILVTTKTGKEGKLSVGYSGYVGFNKPTEMPEFVNSWEWAALYNEAKGAEDYSAEAIRAMREGTDPDKYANVHYLDEILNHTGFQTGHDLTLNGGDNKNKYMVSLGYLSQDGIVEKNNYTRYNARVNLINQLASNLILTTRIAGVYAKIKEPSENAGSDASRMTGMIQQAVRMPAMHPAYLSDGTYGGGPLGIGTPLAGIKSDSFWKNPRYVVDLNMRLDYAPIEGLNLSAIGAYKYTNNEEKKFRASVVLDGGKESGIRALDQMMSKERYKSFQGLADYNKSFGKHNFGLLAGYSWEDKDFNSLSAFRDKLPSNSKPEISTGSQDNWTNSSNVWEWAMQSVFGRFKYNYDEKYLFETTMRYDGSSRFGENHKYGFFPSVAAGWRMSEESFIKDAEDLKWISNLKLKASWGKLGNENIGNYNYQTLYSASGISYPFGNAMQQGAAVVAGRDPNLRWEATETVDGGFEAIMWNGLLSANVTYFYRKTTDILQVPMQSISSIWGLSPREVNSGSLRNTGWEFELGHQNKIGGVKYNVGVNMSVINNKVLDFGDLGALQKNGLIRSGNGLYVGYPAQIYYGYKSDGVFLDQADIDSWYDQSAITPNPKPGDIRYLDLDGDGKVDPEMDKAYLGSRIPKFTYGINLGAEYKGFDFSMLMQGVADVQGRLENFAGHAFRSDIGNIQRWQADGRFDPTNPTRYPSYPRLELLSNVDSANTYLSDFWVQDASYFRVRNIQLGYVLPKSILKDIRLASVRFYIQAENPFTSHKYPKGWDPEINTDGNYYPILKTYTFGVNLKF